MYTNPFQKIPKRKSSWIFNLSVTVLLFFIFGTTSNAQCAMCRASLASEGNKTKAEAVNDGIVYLMVIPYVLVGGIGYAIYRMKKK